MESADCSRSLNHLHKQLFDESLEVRRAVVVDEYVDHVPHQRSTDSCAHGKSSSPSSAEAALGRGQGWIGSNAVCWI